MCVWYGGKTPTLKRQKLWSGLASRTEPTEVAVGNILPKIDSSMVGLSNKKSLMENECLEQKLQLIQYEVFHPQQILLKLPHV
jgi:hypothetical protein